MDHRLEAHPKMHVPNSLHRLHRIGILFSVMILILIQTAFSAHSDSLYVHSDSLDHTITIDGAWDYHAGDDSTWAQPDLDISDWDTLTPRMDMRKIPNSLWTGIGWFRKVLIVDSTLWDENIAMRLNHLGASDIYLNGTQVRHFGTVSAIPDSERIRQPANIPFAVRLDTTRIQTIAVRYSNHVAAERVQWYKRWFRGAGFSMQISALNPTIFNTVGNEQTSNAVNFLLAGLFLSLSLLYFTLFVVFARRKENFFYSLFTFFIAVLFMTGMLTRLSTSSRTFYYVLSIISDVTFSFIFLSYLGFLYSIFYKRFPKLFWLFFTAVVVITTAVFLHIPNKLLTFSVFAFVLISTFEGLRVIIVALKKKKQNAWVIGTGVIIFVGFVLALFVLGIIGKDVNSLWGVGLFFLGILSLPMSMSVYLARDIAQTNKNLERQLTTVKELTEKQIEQERRTAQLKLQAELVESENRRKTKELEEARELQLSMLPSVIPQPPNLEIAAYMNPATEVGGDYYDFHLSSDGTLTVAVGDATGHGLNAGMMVTAAKSLFEALATEEDTVHMMHQSNRVIRQMNFATLKMAICFLKIRDNKLWASGAGMPPLLIYRASTQNLEEIIFHGMPLGSLASFPYEEKQRDLHPGDKVFLMSDGFPERMNENGKMLDYPHAYQAILAASIQSPKKVVEHLVKKGNDWANGRPQDDDVTFVVIEVK